MNLIPSFHNLTTVLQTFLVIPVSDASGERSFSKLRFIENDYRTTMTQKRLNNLIINQFINIEYWGGGTARGIDFGNIVRKHAKIAAHSAWNFFKYMPTRIIFKDRIQDNMIVLITI